MTKTLTTISLDVEVKEKAKIYSDNLSGLINDLLSGWVIQQETDTKDLNPVKLKKLVAEQEKKISVMKSQLKALDDENKVIARF